MRRSGTVRSDAGFSLLESVIALFILCFTLVSGTPFLIGSLRTADILGDRQTAIALAARQLEFVRGVDVNHVVDGRAAGDVVALIAAPGLVDLRDDVTGTGNSDPAAAAGSPDAVVRPVVTTVVDDLTYTTRTYVNVCYLSKTAGTCTASPAAGPAAYRISVDVAWPRSTGVQCASGRAGQCEAVLTTILDPSDDLFFTRNAAPTIASVLRSETGGVAPLGVLHPGQRVSLRFTGTNFVTGAIVVSSGADLTGLPTLNTGTKLTVPFTASLVPGPRMVTVANPDGGLVSATVRVAFSTPTVTSMSAPAATRGTATTVTLTGTDFFAVPTNASPSQRPTIVMVGTSPLLSLPGVSNVVVVSDTKITMTVTWPNGAAPYTATGKLTLTNPDGGTATYSYSTGVG